MKRKLLSILSAVLFSFVIIGDTFAGLIIASGDLTPAWYASDNDNNVFFNNILQGGNNVAVHDLSYSGTRLNDYYNSLTGVSSTYLSNATITASSFMGIDLFVTGMQTDGFSTNELSALDDFVSSGGSVLFMGDYTAPAAYINNALSYIGSGMSLYSPLSATGTHTATGSHIASDPLTAGVSSFLFGYEYGVAGGKSLFLDESGRTFMAYETSAVPVPAAIYLFGSGLAGLFISRFKQRKEA